MKYSGIDLHSNNSVVVSSLMIMGFKSSHNLKFDTFSVLQQRRTLPYR